MLLSIYGESKNVKAVLETVEHILRAMEGRGCVEYDKLPAWIEQVLAKIISFHGINTVARVTEEIEASQALRGAL